MINYDEQFLKQLDRARVRTHYAKIVLLSFDEKPIREIQGTITTGSISVNSSSAIRRTISLTMAIDGSTSDITNIDNEISINKKVRIEIGLAIPFKDWAKVYGDIAWFPQGLFVLSSVNANRSTNSWTLSITAKDKMCLLDGTAGGTLPATIVFHEREIENDDGSITIEYPILRQIIYEAVNHYGCEAPENIFINDLPDQVKMLVKYDGLRTIYFNQAFTSVSYTRDASHTYPFYNGDDAGYEMTDFTYPGELVLKAGDTVVTLLDKIVKLLGNYEYFYDVEGRFIFQEIKNYVNKQSPLDELEDYDSTLPGLAAGAYVRVYDNKRSVYQISDLKAAAAITHTPKYDNIKNDFYVWGKRKTDKTETDIRYHLSIDAKPILDFARQYMWAVTDSKGAILRYDMSYSGYGTTNKKLQIGPPCSEWREELYRQALVAKTQSGFGSYNNYYYEELLTEWRKLYDPTNDDWKTNNELTCYWNPDVFNNPEKLVFWLDFIDSSSEIGKYSVGQIGRRTKVVNNNDIKTIYNKEVPDIVFIPADTENMQELISHYNAIGQRYFLLNSQFQNLFSISATGASCYDEIRDLMYQHLNYQATVSLTCLPIYHLDTNSIIYIEDTESGVVGNYQITQFTLPLTYNGTMSISATEVFTRI